MSAPSREKSLLLERVRVKSDGRFTIGLDAHFGVEFEAAGAASDVVGAVLNDSLPAVDGSDWVNVVSVAMTSVKFGVSGGRT